MGKTSYQSIDQIATEIKNQIAKLNAGELSSSDIENLTHNAQDLYERLIIIRHKAFEKFGEPANSESLESENIAVVEETKNEPIFDFASESETQEEEQETMAFDFSEPIVETETTVPIEKKEEPIVTDTISQTEIERSLNEKIGQTSSSLNDVFKEKKSTSLADKLKQSKIKDLKSSIDINKKFSFITNLFNGSNEAYNAAINQLNNCSDGDQARLVLAELLTKNNWEVEDQTVTSFVEIVERRYI